MRKVLLILSLFILNSTIANATTPAMTSWMGEIENNIDRNKQDINMNKTNIETNANNIEYLYYLTDKQEEQIKNNGNDIINTNQRLDMVQQSGALLQEDVYQMNKKVNKNTKDISNINNNLSNINQQIDNNTKDIQSNSNRITINEDKIKSNSMRIDNNSKAIQSNSREIQTNTRAINNNAQAISGLSNRMNAFDTRLNTLDKRVNKLQDRMESGFATMAALSGLHSNPRAKGKTQIAIAGGMYRDNAAGAIGLFHNFKDNVMLSVGAAYGGDESWAGNVGLTFSW